MRPAYKAYAEYSTIGLELAMAVLLGLFGGVWLDARWGTNYLGLVGFGLGVAVGARAILRAARKMRIEADREEREEREGRDDGQDQP